jgi:hypothetical protein
LEPAYRNGGLHDIVLSPLFAKNQLAEDQLRPLVRGAAYFGVTRH